MHNLFVVLIFALLRNVLSLKITHFSIPRSLTSESRTASLRCDVEGGGGGGGLVLSWYYNQQPSPFLRWTEGDGVADTMGPTFRREDVRLHVRTPSVQRTETTLTISLPRTHPTRVSGTYTCMVHSREGGEEGDVARGNMIVYQRPEEARLLQRHCPGSLVNISCSVAGVFPRPDITILVGSVPVRPDTQYLARDSASSYSLSAWKMVDTAATKSRVVWRLGCEVQLPGTGFSAVLRSSRQPRELGGHTRHAAGAEEELDPGILAVLGSVATLICCIFYFTTRVRKIK